MKLILGLKRCLWENMGEFCFGGVKCDGLYHLIVHDPTMINNIALYFSYIENVSNSNDDDDISFLWHIRLGHTNKITLKRMSDLSLISKFNINLDICEACLSGKMNKQYNKDLKIY